MPEYLAPAVYVEEVDTGSKPIEGVSTSTAGMVGVTERGPVNVPTLVTSYGEYRRWFGDSLNPALYGEHRYLPHAVEGFFSNGGKRVYINRALDVGSASAANRILVAPDDTPMGSQLALDVPAQQSDFIILGDPGFAVGDTVQIDDGVGAEFRSIQGPSAATQIIGVDWPLAYSHAGAAATRAEQVDVQVALGPLAYSSTLAVAAAAGAASITVANAVPAAPASGFVAGDILRIGEDGSAEYLFVDDPPVAGNRINLRAPLRTAHGAAATVTRMAVVGMDAVGANAFASALLQDAGAGGLVIRAVGLPAAIAAGDILRIGAGADAEYLYAAGPALPVDPADPAAGFDIPLRSPLRGDHLAAEEVVRQAPVSATQLAGPGSAQGDALLDLTDRTDFTAQGSFIRLTDTADATHSEIRRIGAFNQIALSPPPRPGVAGGAAYDQYPLGSRLERVDLLVSALAIELLETVPRGATVIRVGDRTLFNPGDLVRIGVGDGTEWLEVLALPAPLPAPNPGSVVLRAPLRRDHAIVPGNAAVNSVVRHVAAPAAVTAAGVLMGPVAVDAASVVAKMPDALADGDFIRIVTAGGGPFYHQVQGASAVVEPRQLQVDTPLLLAHRAGASVTTRQPMIEVRALDAGQWGNRLRVGMEVQSVSLLTTQIAERLSATELRLASAAGVETGTELWVTDAALNRTGHKVAHIDRQNRFLITLEASTPLLGARAGNVVVSREYRFVVELLRQADASNPARNNQVIDREVFNSLSLDPRHSRYFQRVIGCTWDLANPAAENDAMNRPLRRADRRSEGESAYVRVFDLAPGNGLRTGPVASYEVRADGTRRLTLMPLANGSDQLDLWTDERYYIGEDNVDPELRTGLFALRNIEEISIVAAPGRTSVQIQNALINHCELMRYRFAVLDGTPPPRDAMADIQFQRQQFDTKYAALYHPWLLISDPYPVTAGTVPDYPIPPSGHIVGIYARTDIERGVHKAPANEVVRGIIGLQRLLNKEQQDILNPYPVNINVIRDFRPNNRGIRVYGGRVITSDSDWKYVNVRRLLIFIEASIDRGLQWVVFEPNAEPLWARVRRSISNFLRLVWRNGALEGTKPEEAFFVKCDRTTMTQTDIDQGRLICLVGVAPVKPAEFVIVRIGLWTAHADD
jgi:phage tail sheath protein FI